MQKDLKLPKRFFNLIWSISKKKASQNFYSMLSKYVTVFILIVSDLIENQRPTYPESLPYHEPP